MKCRKCAEVAVISMRQHKLSLCAPCFEDWMLQRVEHTIEHYQMLRHDERVLLAVSGGKDSLALWDILTRLGYQTTGVYINLGIDDGDYSETSQSKVASFAAGAGLAYEVVNVAQIFGRNIVDIASRHRRDRRVCSVCGRVKRHEMNRLAVEGGYAAIATGHNLDDEAAILMQNALRWDAGYLARQAPVLPAEAAGLARKVKPLCLCTEREMAAYAIVRGIEYIYDECPHSTEAKTIFYKGLLNELEERSLGAKQHFYQSFLRARAAGQIHFEEAGRPELHPCERCGQPTSAAELCGFCRLAAS